MSERERTDTQPAATLTPLDALAPQHAATLADLAARRLELKQVIAALEADEGELRQKMESLGEELGIVGIEYDGGGDERKRWRFAFHDGRKLLSKELLLTAHLPACTKCGNPNHITARQLELATVRSRGSWRLTGARGSEVTRPVPESESTKLVRS